MSRQKKITLLMALAANTSPFTPERASVADTVPCTPPVISLSVNDETPLVFYPSTCDGTLTDEFMHWTVQFYENTETDPPIASSFLVIQNLTSSINTYSLIFTFAMPAIQQGTLIDGSVGSTVTDSNGDGFAQVAALPGSSFYTAQIDGADVPGTSLLPFPYAAMTSIPGGTAG